MNIWDLSLYVFRLSVPIFSVFSFDQFVERLYSFIICHLYNFLSSKYSFNNRIALSFSPFGVFCVFFWKPLNKTTKHPSSKHQKTRYMLNWYSIRISNRPSYPIIGARNFSGTLSTCFINSKTYWILDFTLTSRSLYKSKKYSPWNIICLALRQSNLKSYQAQNISVRNFNSKQINQEKYLSFWM